MSLFIHGTEFPVNIVYLILHTFDILCHSLMTVNNLIYIIMMLSTISLSPLLLLLSLFCGKLTPLKILSTTAVLNVCVNIDVFVSFYYILVQSQSPFFEFRKEMWSQCWCWLLTADHVAACLPELVFFLVRHIKLRNFYRQTGVTFGNPIYGVVALHCCECMP